MKNIYNEYCTGCGLCESLQLTKMHTDEKGFLFPEKINTEMVQFCDDVCPMGLNGVSNHERTNVWGAYKGFWAGYSADETIRRKASSGGILTSLCNWLVKKHIVDAIIHTTYSMENVTDTQTVVNSDTKKIIECAGSRYSKSSPLINILNIISDGRKYAFVGKPCDVVALSNYMDRNPEIKQSILYLFSFFCAGTPSQIANDRLLNELGVSRNNCRTLNYRGDGWPGYTKAIDTNNHEYTMNYQKAWMDILGRDIRKSCKFCFDSIGEKSDISCGDFWYLEVNGEPDFSEHQGRNCIFAWTDKGKQLIESMASDGEVVLEDADRKCLNKAQPNHFNRRSTLISKIVIMKMAGRKTPKYSTTVLLKCARFTTLIAHCRAIKGTIQRIINGKI